MKYEYKIQPVSVGDEGQRPEILEQDESILNQLGQQGWELVSVVVSPVQYLALGKSFLYFLKRPTP